MIPFRPAFPGTHGGGKRWEYVGQELMAEQHFPRGEIYPLGFTSLNAPVGSFTISLPGYATPPWVRIIDPTIRFIVDNFRHLEFEFVGYHKRRVKRRGHKIGRMNGHQRRIMGATFFACVNGFYPPWDVLGRHPTEAEVDAGATPVGDWRWGVTGNYPS